MQKNRLEILEQCSMGRSRRYLLWDHMALVGKFGFFFFYYYLMETDTKTNPQPAIRSKVRSSEQPHPRGGAALTRAFPPAAGLTTQILHLTFTTVSDASDKLLHSPTLDKQRSNEDKRCDISPLCFVRKVQYQRLAGKEPGCSRPELSRELWAQAGAQ